MYLKFIFFYIGSIPGQSVAVAYRTQHVFHSNCANTVILSFYDMCYLGGHKSASKTKYSVLMNKTATYSKNTREKMVHRSQIRID